MDIFCKKNKPNKIEYSSNVFCIYFFSFIVFLITDGGSIGIKNEAFLPILYLGIFCTSIAFFIQTYAQNKVHANKTAIFLSTESIFGTIFSIVLLGESLTLKLIFGCIIIFIAILISEVEFNRTKPQENNQ